MIYKLQFRIIILIFFIIIITLFIIHSKYISTDKTSICRQPTMINPYANYLLTDISHLSACISKQYDIIKDEYNDFNVYHNSKDININSLSKNKRTFYTTAVTSNPNDLDKFIQFIYN